MLKRKYTYLFVITSLALLLSLLGLGGCPTTEKFTLTTNISPAGAGSVSPSSGEYDSGVTVTLTATPATGYTFDYWSGSTAGTSPTTTLVMDSDKSVTAYFEATAPTEKFTLTVNISPPGAGSVSPSGGEYDAGVAVTLTATPDAGYTFDYWSGSASGTSSATTLVMDSDKSVTAYFEATPPTPKVLFSDDFSDEGSGWDTYSDEEGSAFYQDGWLHIKDNPFGSYAENSFAHQYFTDFVLEVETKLVLGIEDNWHRIICRTDQADNYYNFDISADGYYEILKFVNGNRIVLKEPTTSIHIYKGRDVVNLMRVECIGSALRLFVNGHLLAEVTDFSFTGGDIALGADSLGGTQFTEVAFDNIVVTEP